MMAETGRTYDRKLTRARLVAALTDHPSNVLLLLQGFFSNVPWGVMFVFLNDFLGQERGLTVPDATGLVAVFGGGCAVGGVVGGFLGQSLSSGSGNSGNGDPRRRLPLFMSIATLIGILPFLALLDDPSYHGYDRPSLWKPYLYAFFAGCISSLPSVNVRPCLINVNPPELRGAALTAANLIINLARGAGPTFLTTMMGVWNIDRTYGLNVLVSEARSVIGWDRQNQESSGGNECTFFV